MSSGKPRIIDYCLAKRGIDIVVSTLALVLLSPILLIIAICIWLNLGRPVLFHQRRPGLNGHLFTLIKFRTMADKLDENGRILPDAQRLTSFGKWLRATSLDEIPELINVLKGDMSLVGPRPLLERYLPYYTEVEQKRHSVRPGLTGLAQVSGRNFVNWDKRLQLDVDYVENMSLALDLKILWHTIWQALRRQGVAEDVNEVMKDLDEERAEPN